jgi:hypothetical protein
MKTITLNTGNFMKKLLIGLTLLASMSSFAHDNTGDSNTVCGIEGVSLSHATSGTNPVEVKQDYLSEEVQQLHTCDYGKSIAIAVVLKNGNREALIFN